MMVFMVVDLPDAFPPRRQTSSPGRTSRETSQRTWTGPYLVETLRSSSTVLPPQVRLDNVVVVADLFRKTLGDLFPMVED